MGKIARNAKPFRSSTWNEYYTNECQSSDSDRSATNAGSMRTKFCVSRGRYDRQRTLVIRITGITLASDSATTIARFRPSKLGNMAGECLQTRFARHGSAQRAPKQCPMNGVCRMLWGSASRHGLLDTVKTHMAERLLS